MSATEQLGVLDATLGRQLPQRPRLAEQRVAVVL